MPSPTCGPLRTPNSGKKTQWPISQIVSTDRPDTPLNCLFIMNLDGAFHSPNPKRATNGWEIDPSSQGGIRGRLPEALGHSQTNKLVAELVKTKANFAGFRNPSQNNRVKKATRLHESLSKREFNDTGTSSNGIIQQFSSILKKGEATCSTGTLRGNEPIQVPWNRPLLWTDNRTPIQGFMNENSALPFSRDMHLGNSECREFLDEAEAQNKIDKSCSPKNFGFDGVNCIGNASSRIEMNDLNSIENPPRNSLALDSIPTGNDSRGIGNETKGAGNTGSRGTGLDSDKNNLGFFQRGREAFHIRFERSPQPIGLQQQFRIRKKEITDNMRRSIALLPPSSPKCLGSDKRAIKPVPATFKIKTNDNLTTMEETENTKEETQRKPETKTKKPRTLSKDMTAMTHEILTPGIKEKTSQQWQRFPRPEENEGNHKNTKETKSPAKTQREKEEEAKQKNEEKKTQGKEDKEEQETSHVVKKVKKTRRKHGEVKQEDFQMFEKYASRTKSGKKKDMEEYILGKVIGKGAYASVRLAISKETGQKVAVKTYEKTRLCEESRRKNVRRETEILARAKHPSIIKIFDFFHTETHVTSSLMESFP